MRSNAAHSLSLDWLGTPLSAPEMLNWIIYQLLRVDAVGTNFIVFKLNTNLAGELLYVVRYQVKEGVW